ncbi:tRNA (adenosine(37)-N6)-threonylcarbamoyltransferase complex ATPase subunit type 1 TsaE [Paenalcaligenes niemegkensis]|uniref:tRNA (adenosine(37)-N6)-threonylcarbamoyltransferase complex ATPase subunit type 1 TsaE n=1 Tax=Paenalcaligenes niemegkensis TaxID=2895469 RepID=UPI001EE79FAE|nr:tRNA (adenosine(37)-N6)-threonylcarbamoyltransferase complex ATPase subunit type 1 TsaE [Paenalcaligenes niemegkensis]MCQ9615846.1 tRNA (adenosine(37)-N6)-threonylcarbamoyltransferase complex ATPase subunit type 1 TsaE [Paenalcaligenes niemegkensis]
MSTTREPLATLQLYAADEAVTQHLAELLSPIVCGKDALQRPENFKAGGHIHLEGDLGAGKTSFTRAFLRKAGVTERIKSPSYALIESYNLSSLNAYHLDFYRFSDSREWLDAGFRDILQENAVVLIEWPEKAGKLLPLADLTIKLDYCEPGRQIQLAAYSKKGKEWLTTLKPLLREFPLQD